MRRMTWNDALVGLSLVHLGQELGTDSAISRAVFDLLTVFVCFAGRISQLSGI